MVDCRTTLEQLELASVSQRDEMGGEVADHLASCEPCRTRSERLDRFDRKVRESLLSVDVPDDLEARILAAVGSASSESDPIRHVSAPLVPAAGRRERRAAARLRVWMLAGIAVCALTAGLVLWAPAPHSTLDYPTAQQALSEQFRRDRAAWETLPEFDGNFSLHFDRELNRLRLSAPRGLDLDGDRQHDAAVYQFSAARWQGVLIVLPTDRFEGEPETPSPRLVSGQRSLEWRSVDGSVTYLCFVHTGSVEQFAAHLFGRMA